MIVWLLALQTIGALIGAGAVLWGEFAYIRAMRDGRVTHAEREHLDRVALGLRFGMVLLLLSSLGLVIANYLAQSVTSPATSASYWILITLALLIVWASWALSRGRVSFAYGSALLFSAWWFLAYLTLGLLPVIAFSSAVAAFVVATALFYALLQTTRFFLVRKR